MKHSEERIIAFIDILGFKNIIDNAESNQNYSLITNLLTESVSLFKELNKKQDFQFTQFSDCFVLSSKSFAINDSMEFMIHLQDLINLFLEEGILLRGGVTIGKVIHTKKLLVGTGMNRAYELESKAAIFPRIIIDNELSKLWEAQLEFYNFENVLEISKDSDGFYYMDYIKKSNKVFTNTNKILKEKIKQLLSFNDLRVQQKGQWIDEKMAHL